MDQDQIVRNSSQPTQITADPSQVKGWGVDANPKNEPTYPMRHRVDGEHDGHGWEPPPPQPRTVEVLQSNEWSKPPAVFGTSTPPSGLSGLIRRFAFKYSESSYAHWLPLMLADRVNMVEGLVDDLLHGHVPNLFVELGYRADWKHNRASLLLKIASWVTLAVAAVAYLRGRRSR